MGGRGRGEGGVNVSNVGLLGKMALINFYGKNWVM
jgi:hypothetical protein